MRGETGKKAEQGTNLKADVADRPHAHLSNVRILARQVLHLYSHREASIDHELLVHIIPDCACFLLPPALWSLPSQSPCQCPGSPAAAPQAQARLAPAPKQLNVSAMQLQKTMQNQALCLLSSVVTRYAPTQSAASALPPSSMSCRCTHSSAVHDAPFCWS